MQSIKIIVEKQSHSYVVDPIRVEGVVIGEGNSYEEALSDVRLEICFHIETFGTEVLNSESPSL